MLSEMLDEWARKTIDPGFALALGDESARLGMEIPELSFPVMYCVLGNSQPMSSSMGRSVLRSNNRSVVPSTERRASPCRATCCLVWVTT